MATVYLRSDFSDGPDLQQLASSWGRSRNDTLGYFLSFAFAIDQPAALSGEVVVKPETKAWMDKNETLFAAMIECGWVRRIDFGRLKISFPASVVFNEPTDAPVMELRSRFGGKSKEVR